MKDVTYKKSSKDKEPSAIKKNKFSNVTNLFAPNLPLYEKYEYPNDDAYQ